MIWHKHFGAHHAHFKLYKRFSLYDEQNYQHCATPENSYAHFLSVIKRNLENKD